MNRIGLVSPNLAVLGPGGTWADVLRKLPPTKYTLIHGQCTSVGVAGYILGWLGQDLTDSVKPKLF